MRVSFPHHVCVFIIQDLSLHVTGHNVSYCDLDLSVRDYHCSTVKFDQNPISRNKVMFKAQSEIMDRQTNRLCECYRFLFIIRTKSWFCHCYHHCCYDKILYAETNICCYLFVCRFVWFVMYVEVGVTVLLCLIILISVQYSFIIVLPGPSLQWPLRSYM